MVLRGAVNNEITKTTNPRHHTLQSNETII